jgi:predicted unusual protein kinase regulating ubiquinone biosynthesis (AarF/ABC1/UbiB family)
MNIAYEIWSGFIDGRDMASFKAAGLDRKLIASRGARAVLKMVLVSIWRGRH